MVAMIGMTGKVNGMKNSGSKQGINGGWAGVMKMVDARSMLEKYV